MAQIKQVGVGRKTIGTIDGITYYVRGGVTYARSTPTMPASVYNTLAAKKRQAIFKMVQMHLKLHLRTINQTFTPTGNGSPINCYYSKNGKALTLALASLAEQYVAGVDVTITDVENAISAYAAEHPTAITIGHLSGYQDVYLTGAWPETITLNANQGDSTVIIIMAENGTTTIINADGTVTTGNGQQSGGQQTTDNGQQSGGQQTTNNGQQSGIPHLTISRSGSGTSTVTAGGNAVNSGAELAAGTEVSLSVTPAQDATPTATLNGNSVTLTESDGVYTGSFTMPSTNATLFINTGGSSGSGDGDDEN